MRYIEQKLQRFWQEVPQRVCSFVFVLILIRSIYELTRKQIYRLAFGRLVAIATTVIICWSGGKQKQSTNLLCYCALLPVTTRCRVAHKAVGSSGPKREGLRLTDCLSAWAVSFDLSSEWLLLSFNTSLAISEFEW
jgi:hypothetical protein